MAKDNWGRTGRDAMREMDRMDKERKDKVFMPFRFWLNAGEFCEIVILSDDFVNDDPERSQAFLVKEHHYKKGGKWGNFASCCADFADCPACNALNSGPQTQLMLSVYVVRPYTPKKKGSKPRKGSRMLLPITGTMRDVFLSLQDQADKRPGGMGMRGMILTMKRGNGDKDPRIGMPQIRKSGKTFGFLSEDTLVERYGHKARKNDRGEVTQKANEDIQPFDMGKLFPKPDPKALRKLFPGGASVGADDDDWDNDNEEEEEDDIPGVKSGKGGKSGGSRSSRRETGEEEEEETGEEETGEDGDPIDNEGGDEEGQEEEEEVEPEPAPPVRRTARKTAAKKAAGKPKTSDDGWD